MFRSKKLVCKLIVQRFARNTTSVVVGSFGSLLYCQKHPTS